MVNVWDYANVNTVRLLDTEGKEYKGKVAEIIDSDVEDDLNEDEIVIFDNGEYISFKQSEIQEITEL